MWWERKSKARKLELKYVKEVSKRMVRVEDIIKKRDELHREWLDAGRREDVRPNVLAQLRILDWIMGR